MKVSAPGHGVVKRPHNQIGYQHSSSFREGTPELLSRVSILPTIRRPLRIQPVHHRHQPILYHHLPQ